MNAASGDNIDLPKNNRFTIKPMYAFYYVLSLVLFSLPAYSLISSLNFESNIKNWITPMAYALQFLFVFTLSIFLQKKNEQPVEFSFFGRVRFVTFLLAIPFFVSTIFFAQYLVNFIPRDGVFLAQYKLFESQIQLAFKYVPSAILVICVFAPILEEMFFRGLILKGLLNNDKLPVWFSIFFSSLLFAIPHFFIWSVISAFILGLVLALVYYYTRTLWLVILLHFLNNALSAYYFLKTNDLEMQIFGKETQPYEFIIFLSIPFLLYSLVKTGDNKTIKNNDK